MARVAYACTLGSSLGEGRFNSSVGGAPGGSIVTLAGTADTDAGTASGTLTTNVAAAVAVLVADAASPTQAHVNTLNTAWGLLATAIAAAKTSTAAAKAAGAVGDVVLDIDTAVVTTKNGMRAALRQLMQAVDGSGLAS